MKIRNSLVRKYFLVSLLGAVLPMVLVSALYDRYASALLEQITGERLSSQLAATASRLNAFFDVRTYQIETISNHPALPLLAKAPLTSLDAEIESLLRIEADVPDLYGILMFGAGGQLSRIIAGQAASGAPYWSDLSFDVSTLPVTHAAGVDVIGPVAPADGASGWFLMRQSLRNLDNGDRAGSIALHVRLASVTELLGGASLAGILQPVLKTPAGIFNVVGQPVSPSRQMVPGPEVLPGWQPMLVVDPDQLIKPFTTAQRGLYFAGITALLVIIVLFTRLAGRLRRKLEPLTEGAEAVSAGNLDYRIKVLGDDEISLVAASFNSMASKLQEMFDRTVRMERLAVLGEFATGVAHEIRNPLATIKTTVQALARNEKDDERLELLHDVAREIDRLNRVMSDLLEFGRPRPPNAQAVSAHDLLARLYTLMNPSALQACIELDVIDAHSDITFHADEDQVIQILVNLILNALQATPAGGAVSLRVSRTSMIDAAIEVCDTGTGVTEDILARMTDPFFTTKPKGSGLGLSIARQLAELQGGGLEFFSVPGEGTMVRLTLPTQGDTL